MTKYCISEDCIRWKILNEEILPIVFYIKFIRMIDIDPNIFLWFQNNICYSIETVERQVVCVISWPYPWLYPCHLHQPHTLCGWWRWQGHIINLMDESKLFNPITRRILQWFLTFYIWSWLIILYQYKETITSKKKFWSIRYTVYRMISSILHTSLCM